MPPPLFIADPSHEDAENIVKLIKMLPELAEQGYKTLFLEFVLRDPPKAEKDIADQWVWCSNRDIKNVAATYAQLVVEARKCGMRVVGLSLPAYYLNSGQLGGPRAREAFRMVGGFDRIAAEIIRQESGPSDYVVFLGAGHWPYLSKHLEMKLVGKSYSGPSASDFPSTAVETAAENTAKLLKQIVLANVEIKFSIDDKAQTSKTHIRVLEGGKWWEIKLVEGASLDVVALLWEAGIGTKPDPEKLKIILDEVKGRILPPLKLKLKD